MKRVHQYSIHNTATDRRCAMSHSNKSQLKNWHQWQHGPVIHSVYLQPSTTLQNSTPNQVGQNPKSTSQDAIYHGILDKTKSLPFHTLSGRIGRWLPGMLKLQGRSQLWLRLHRFILCTRRSGGTVHEGGGCDQSIGFTVSDAIVCSWLWSPSTWSSTLGYFSRLLQVVDNWPHTLW